MNTWTHGMRTIHVSISVILDINNNIYNNMICRPGTTQQTADKLVTKLLILQIQIKGLTRAAEKCLRTLQ